MLKMTLILILMLCLVLAALPHIVWGIGWCIGKCFHYSLPYAPFGWTAAGLVVMALLILAYGYWIGRWRLQVTEVGYHSNDLPEAFEGFKIVHISDLHLGTFSDNPKQLERIVKTINEQEPDLVCFTGDIVNLNPEEATPFIGILQDIKAKYGVCSVLGNHDFFIYSRTLPTAKDKEEAVERLANMQRDSLHWHLLRNASYCIEREGEKITILGVDNSNCANQGFHTINKGDLQKAMQDTDGFRILLSHDPSHWTAEVLPHTDIQLTLSGHTHAAQVRLLGWTPASWTFVETDGLYQQGYQSLYINIGLGCTAPFRLGANPEITVITLQAGATD